MATDYLMFRVIFWVSFFFATILIASFIATIFWIANKKRDSDQVTKIIDEARVLVNKGLRVAKQSEESSEYLTHNTLI